MTQLVDGRYELLDVIASGGMATVWRARDIRLDRLVAVKRPHPGAGDGQWRERLEREARIAAGISHPNLVTIFDTGSDEDGPFLVMELVEGPTLAEAISSQSVGSAATTGAQLAAALAAVHAAGIVHRDIKPANIMIGEDGPLLTDFGIARRPDDLDGLTIEGAVVATPSYAAPEILSGGEPTPAGDVFALGAVLYEMTSGSPAFRGFDRTPPPPVDDPVLDAVIRSTLDPDPDRRPTAARVVEALDHPTTATLLLTPARVLAAPTAGAGPLPPTVGSTPAAPERGIGPRRLAPILAAAALVVIAAAAFAVSRDGEDTGGGSEPPATQPIDAAPAVTAQAPTTSAAPTTTETAATTPPTTTTAPTGDPRQAALLELQTLEALVSDLTADDVKRQERDRMLDSITALMESIDSGQGDDDDDDDRPGRDRRPNRETDVPRLLDDLERDIARIGDPEVSAEAQAALDRLRDHIDDIGADD